MKGLVLCTGNRCRSRIILIRTYEKKLPVLTESAGSFHIILMLIIQPSQVPCRHPSQALS